MKKRIGRLRLDRLADVLDRQFVLPCLTGNQAQQVQGISIVGVHLQDLPVNRHGLLQMACLVVLRRYSQCFRNGCHNFEKMKDEG